MYVKEHVGQRAGGRLSRYFRVRCFSANVSGAVVHKFSPNDTGARKEGGKQNEAPVTQPRDSEALRSDAARSSEIKWELRQVPGGRRRRVTRSKLIDY